MTVLLLILAVVWVAVLVLVVACCVSAARGDAALLGTRPHVPSRSGRFSRDPRRRLAPRARLR